MNSILKKFDTYLNKLPKSQVIMLYLVVLFIGFSLVYNFVPDMIFKHSSLKSEIGSLHKKLQRSSIPRLKRALANNKKLLLNKKEELRSLKEQTTFTISKLYSLKFTLFDEKEWVNTLNKILKKSVIYDIEIKSVKNSDIDKSAQTSLLVKKKKNISIEVAGSFANMLRYINYIESLPILLKFGNIKFNADKEKVKALMIFDIYGVGI